MWTISLFMLLVLLATCARADAPSFAGQVLPLLKSRCLVCHMPGSEAGGMSLLPKTAYANLVGMKSTQSTLLLVAPGKPDESYLYLKITGRHLGAGGSGERMPFNETPLSTEDVELVRTWIESGARP